MGSAEAGGEKRLSALLVWFFPPPFSEDYEHMMTAAQYSDENGGKKNSCLDAGTVWHTVLNNVDNTVHVSGISWWHSETQHATKTAERWEIRSVMLYFTHNIVPVWLRVFFVSDSEGFNVKISGFSLFSVAHGKNQFFGFFGRGQLLSTEKWKAERGGTSAHEKTVHRLKFQKKCHWASLSRNSQIITLEVCYD